MEIRYILAKANTNISFIPLQLKLESIDKEANDKTECK